MKKTGFTLSEVIVALGIISVIAVITAPILGGIIPDKNKVAVLKIYKTVSEINKDLLNTPVLYRDSNVAGSECTGLECTARPLEPEYAEDADDTNAIYYEEETKYMALLAKNLNTVSTDLGSNTFTTADGFVWTFTNLENREFTVDIDPEKEIGMECKNADEYSFAVNARGIVTGNDALTQAYLANPHKLNDRQKDYEAAGL